MHLDLSLDPDAIKILSNAILHSDNQGEISGVGYYIYECVRNAIGHIQRAAWAKGKCLEIDSWKELQHLHDVCLVLHKFARDKMGGAYNINKPDDLKYLCYFEP